ncbi:UbiA prenyltransferase family-domain-containing protein [Mycena rosella]|uniref:UbiA prenyltransferase family-domain-containing protein n=1 Tax=Mycena rosella TaxID=1033263 RepID=A0AAD7GM67_MYCRO|nr:UbiA prenyltransferase family-domain-containing protein [Mycena rosella]
MSSYFNAALLIRAGSIRYNILTLYLFSRTDIKTTFLPVTLFSIGCAPACNMGSALQCMFWLWLQLLHFNLANQTSRTSVEEDSKNKPFRPLPSGRITLQQAIILRYISLISGLALSAMYGLRIFLINVGFAVLIVMYHDFQGGSHWLSKNLMNAAGYCFFEAGGTLIAACDRQRFDDLAKWSLMMSLAILATTIQAQDFQDREGDRTAGRRTLPIVFPVISRYTMLFCLPGWSVILGHVWQLDLMARSAVIILGTIVGFRYFTFRTVRDDEWTYFLYNGWLLVAFSLPIYSRHFRGD